MGTRINLAETYHFRVAGTRLTVYKKRGESYEHVLMKALGFVLYLPHFPLLEVERRIGLRYKPDLIALDEQGKADFWGECGHVGLRKVGWLAKHSGARQIALFKYAITAKHFIQQMQDEVEPKYRPAGRLTLFNFAPLIVHEINPQHQEEINDIPPEWYERYDI